MFYDILLFFTFWSKLTDCGPNNYEIFSYLCTYKERFAILLSKPMDSTHISGKQLLFAYCITDGVLDEMTEEQKASIISIIESLLSEGEDANNERLLSGENRNQ